MAKRPELEEAYMKRKPELVVDVITKKNTTYLPSQITFSSLAKKREVSEALGFETTDELDRYLNNHFMFTVYLDDVPTYATGDVEKIKKSEQEGLVTVDWDNKRMVDCWGLEFEMFAPNGFNNLRNPLKDCDEDEIDAWTAPSIDAVDMDTRFQFADADLKKYGEEYLVMVSGYNGIFEKGYNLLEFGNFMCYLLTEPDMIDRLLGKVTDFKVEIAKETAKRGFMMGHYGDDLGMQTGELFSLDAFRRSILPHIKRVFRVFKDAGLPVQMHSCGNIVKFIPDLIDAGLDVLEPVQPVMDIQYLKREFGKDLTFYGGVDTQELLVFDTPERVREETLRTIDVLGKGGGYIVAPAQEVMPDVPLENILAFIEAVKSVQS
jgi:uroporphyrinogen decarboxylase